MSSNAEKRAKGIEMFKKSYGDALMEPPPEGQDPFFDIMLETLFGTVWAREEHLAMRDRRLFTMGIIAAMGQADVFEIQVGCALKNQELTEEQIRELIIHLAPYAGYPRVGSLRGAAEKAIQQYNKSKQSDESA
jgi:4-carboxymuconolactone decarboxylase